MALGAKLGADVPFFIFQKPALARGMGEKLTAGEPARPALVFHAGSALPDLHGMGLRGL